MMAERRAEHPIGLRGTPGKPPGAWGRRGAVPGPLGGRQVRPGPISAAKCQFGEGRGRTTPPPTVVVFLTLENFGFV